MLVIRPSAKSWIRLRIEVGPVVGPTKSYGRLCLPICKKAGATVAFEKRFCGWNRVRARTEVSRKRCSVQHQPHVVAQPVYNSL